ncbi:MAG: head decoration protein [Proteobacteria bacterium]|nr:head decoration protein [Pseudomonadota bacterium]
MANITITNNDLGNVIVEGNADHDDIIVDAATRTIPAGTILARNATTLKLGPFVKGGTAAVNGVANSVLAYDLDIAAGVDTPIRVFQTGKVNFSRLIIDADGDNSNVDAEVKDALRSFGIETVSVSELNILDNQ